MMVKGGKMKMFFNHGIHRIHGMVLLAVAALGTSLTSFAADPVITVSARQRYPWNGLVDVHFTITGDAGTKYDTSFTAKDMVGNTNIAMRTIRKADGTAAAAKEQLLPGTYSWAWDAAADLPTDFKCDRVTVTGTVNKSNPLYMVIDLSSGANSSKYPVSSLNAVPSGGWSDTYKTAKLVLRRIEPGFFKMCGQYNVTLTQQFYIGVFEVTQKQYERVQGENPSVHSYLQNSAKMPVEDVSYNGLRGSSWPSSANVVSTSFMGKLRSRTGYNFDLPTEAQWEYACRAGTTSSYNNGGSSVSDLNELGWYNVNAGSTSGPVVVGSYKANAWGLYDMHGNVAEWCLDYYSSKLSSGVTDPKGPTSSGSRVLRGGSFASTAAGCTSSIRSYNVPSVLSNSTGFRLCLTLQ